MANDGTTPLGSGVGITKHVGDGSGPHLPPTSTPHDDAERAERAVVEVGRPGPVGTADDARTALGAPEPVAVGLHPGVVTVLDL